MKCKDCGTEDQALHYRSGKMKLCYDCQNYANLKTKATGGGVNFTREQFVAWKRADASRRSCAYCGISAADLHKLGAVNVRTKKVYESIGVDRRDNTRPYTLDNLIPCCGPCNAIKGSILTDAEMMKVGKVLAKAWATRLGRV